MKAKTGDLVDFDLGNDVYMGIVLASDEKGIWIFFLDNQQKIWYSYDELEERHFEWEIISESR